MRVLQSRELVRLQRMDSTQPVDQVHPGVEQVYSLDLFLGDSGRGGRENTVAQRMKSALVLVSRKRVVEVFQGNGLLRVWSKQVPQSEQFVPEDCPVLGQLAADRATISIRIM